MKNIIKNIYVIALIANAIYVMNVSKIINTKNIKGKIYSKYPEEDDVNEIKERIEYYKNEIRKIKEEEKNVKQKKKELNDGKIQENKKIKEL